MGLFLKLSLVPLRNQFISFILIFIYGILKLFEAGFVTVRLTWTSHISINIDIETCKADGDNDEFSPEGPLEVSLLYLVSGPLNQHVEAPYDAGDGHKVEGDAAAELPSLQGTHVKLLPLSQRFYLTQTSDVAHM